MSNIESEIKHFFYDSTNNAFKSFDKNELENELDKIAKTIQVHLTKLEEIGNFELDSVQVTLGVKGNILVIGVDGGITLTYSKIKSISKS